MSEQFFARVASRLTATGQTREAASKRAGRNRDYIRDMARKGSVPSSRNLAGLARALECSSEYLLGLTDEVGTPPADEPSSDGSDSAADGLTDEERLLIFIYRSLAKEDRDWLWQQIRREAMRAGIALDADE